MHIDYSNHNGNKKTILIYYDMTFHIFYLFISSDTVQRNVVPPIWHFDYPWYQHMVPYFDRISHVHIHTISPIVS